MVRHRPKPHITWWMRVRRFFYDLESPLRLRTSLIRLGHRHKYPFFALLRLFWPFPTWHFRVPDQVPLKTMVNNVPLLDARAASTDLANMSSVPLWRARDTPLRALYRIYEAMVAREPYAIGPQVEYFFYQNQKSWKVSRIPDPCDCDPVRYAILACVAEELARAFNWRMSVGMRRDKRKHIYRKTFEDPLPPFVAETAPRWTWYVPAFDVESIADLPGNMRDVQGRLVLEDGGENPSFAERNIVANTGHFYTV